MNIKARELTPVKSSQISAMGHDAAHKVMTVQFKNGSTYEYQNVDEALYNKIMSADSVGKAFDAEIKKQAGAHPFSKVA